MKNKKHYVLGFERRFSGAFEHAFGVAKNLDKRNFNAEYFTHWWDAPTKKVNLYNESSVDVDVNSIKNSDAIYHLQTHTWEHGGHLDNIIGEGNKLIYNLHAIIPYYYLSSDDKKIFLEGNLPREKFQRVIDDVMDDKQRAQLSAIEKADYLFTISSGHKKVLELMGVDKPVYVFENVTDFDDFSNSDFERGKELGFNYRKELNSENVLMYCGALYPKKGSFGIFDSFREIRKQDKSAKLILLGPGESQKEGLLSSGLKEEDLESIVMVPWIMKNTKEGKMDFLKYYNAADVLLQPMITDELYSKSVVDAMMIGLPAITCRSPYTIGASENKDEILKSFEFMKNNPESVRKIVDSAKKKVMRENTWDSYVSRIENIIS